MLFGRQSWHKDVKHARKMIKYLSFFLFILALLAVVLFHCKSLKPEDKTISAVK